MEDDSIRSPLLLLRASVDDRSSSSSSSSRPSFWSRITAKKPLHAILAEEAEGKLDRSLELSDLLAIGIGGTVGSGIFVTAGLIAHCYAGPAVVLSWIIGGIVCAVSGISYAEMSSRLPSAGSTYAYTFHAMGELPACIVGGLLTLEYGVSGAAVARSWGDKVAFAAAQAGLKNTSWLNSQSGSLMSGIVQALCVALLMGGMSIGKRAIKLATVIKVILVIFMIIVGACIFDSSLLTPLIPPEHEFIPSASDRESGLQEKMSFGMAGVFAGATQAFFGFVGFDEVCCMAAQTKDSRKIMPRAVLGTIVGVTVLSTIASLTLVASVPYSDISGVAGFSSAFQQRGLNWAESIVSVGEIVTLPVVVLIAFLAQPQLMFAMAQDGLLPAIFARTNKSKTLWWGTLISGILMTTIAIFVPFTNLGDMISAGVLISFNFTNASLVLTRLRVGSKRKRTEDFGKATLALFTVFSAVSAFLWNTGNVAFSTVLFAAILAASCLAALCYCFYSSVKAGRESADTGFRVPLVPLLPCIGIAANWYLVSTMSSMGLFLILGFMAICCLFYFSYGYRNSASLGGWDHRECTVDAVKAPLGTGEFRMKASWTRPRSKTIP